VSNTRDKSQRFTIANKNKAPRVIVLEPWAEEHVLAAGEKLEIIFSEEPISLDLTMEQRGRGEMYTEIEAVSVDGVAIDVVVLWVESGAIVRVDKVGDQ
jgi:hypothetical protein